VVVDAKYLKEHLNFDKTIFEIVQVSVLQIESNLQQAFYQEDLLDLDTEISNYTNLEDTETPKFGKQDQTDTSY
jgi:hypothetical protein